MWRQSGHVRRDWSFTNVGTGTGAALRWMQYHTPVSKYGVKATERTATSGMLIGTFAAAVGVSIETIRYYDRQGAMPSVTSRGMLTRPDRKWACISHTLQDLP